MIDTLETYQTQWQRAPASVRLRGCPHNVSELEAMADVVHREDREERCDADLARPRHMIRLHRI